MFCIRTSQNFVFCSPTVCKMLFKLFSCQMITEASKQFGKDSLIAAAMRPKWFAPRMITCLQLRTMRMYRMKARISSRIYYCDIFRSGDSALGQIITRAAAMFLDNNSSLRGGFCAHREKSPKKRINGLPAWQYYSVKQYGCINF
ncbi:Hypothetical_protein [Hexamita inflata]|uniref:Hypothetical_protein n=1 Tax=Hexamita inflata TaxID=28002 RepID=A0AA86NA43_9EUKA|nr:Hypothetical protein HINF_LOCUS2854 [Hexamita inflata]